MARLRMHGSIRHPPPPIRLHDMQKDSFTFRRLPVIFCTSVDNCVFTLSPLGLKNWRSRIFCEHISSFLHIRCISVLWAASMSCPLPKFKACYLCRTFSRLIRECDAAWHNGILAPATLTTTWRLL
jgi:hypothetical protein